jgi:8-oxo-dGTP pyrophosphatase MutT (NUDIX family)
MTEKSPIREYRSAGGVVVRRAGNQVLVLKRPKRLDQNGRPEMRLPKGHIEPGEKPKEAALREVCEETGLRALEILSDLGHQIVEFEWKGHHYVRDESCFLNRLWHFSLS